MTELRPCTACRRHVAATETACPFCAAALAPVAPRALARGKLSRAAVFATGALAATACGGGHKSTTTTTTTTSTTATSDAAPMTPDASMVAEPPVDPVDPPHHDHAIPKPYGAPPARRRIV